MTKSIDIWEKPKAKEMYLLAGWRQWVDGGATSSGLPQYIIQQTKARKIGEMKPDSFYLFQLPGMQHLMRPIVQHDQGYSKSLQTPRNEFFYTEMGGKGIVIFIGDEPHVDAERYTKEFLEAIELLKIKRVVMFGGIYAEVPYDKERMITSVFSLQSMREEISDLTVDLSNYQGPGSIGSYLCKRGGEQEIEVVGFYTFCPIYQFGNLYEVNKMIRIEKDYIAWIGVMQRLNHMLGIDFNLDDLEDKGDQLIERLNREVEELDNKYPDLGVEEYMQRLATSFEEKDFNPLEDVWQDELRRLGDQFFPSDE